jgi:hypothetical protein
LTTLPLFSKRPATQIIYFSDMTLSASLSLRTLGNSDLQLTPIGLGT